jgi:hypothetical protein
MRALLACAAVLTACNESPSKAPPAPAGSADAAVTLDAAAPKAPKAPKPPVDASTADTPPPPAPLKRMPLPLPWKVDNIGRTVPGIGAPAGEYLNEPDTTRFVLSTPSLDVGGTDDSCQFVNQVLKGDGELIARVRGVDYTSALAKAGLMLRASLDPKAPNVFLAILGGGIGHVQARTTAGGMTVKDDTDKINIKAGGYLRLERKGNTVTAYRGDRRMWTKIASFDLTLPNDVFIGVAANSSSTELLGQHEFDYVRINNFGSDPALAGWYHEDLGLIGGSSVFEGGAKGTLNVQTFGYPWSATQEFGAYTFKEVKGDARLTFRVRAFEENNNARVAAMFRNGSVTSVSRSHAHVAVSVLGSGVEFQHRAGNGGQVVRATATAAAGIKTPVWIRLERAGNRFVGYQSSDGKDDTWKMLGEAELPLGANQQLGVIVNAGVNTKVGSAQIDNVSLEVMGGGPIDGGAPTSADGGARPDGGAPADAAAGGDR